MLTLSSSSELLAEFLENVPQGQQRQYLRLAKHDNEQLLKELEASRLGYVERGQDDDWQQQYEATKANLAAIAQGLAAC
jgi:phage terminase Nu1 subunit (DNA packaging protein)